MEFLKRYGRNKIPCRHLKKRVVKERSIIKAIRIVRSKQIKNLDVHQKSKWFLSRHESREENVKRATKPY